MLFRSEEGGWSSYGGEMRVIKGGMGAFSSGVSDDWGGAVWYEEGVAAVVGCSVAVFICEGCSIKSFTC